MRAGKLPFCRRTTAANAAILRGLSTLLNPASSRRKFVAARKEMGIYCAIFPDGDIKTRDE
jgi:DMSO/TMAO reductase YedYZ heme-binding membrane subunit